MSDISLRHDTISAALAGHHATHTEALAAITPPAVTEGVPADVLASIGLLVDRGQQIHSDALTIGRNGEQANQGLADTDRGNAGRFDGGGSA